MGVTLGPGFERDGIVYDSVEPCETDTSSVALQNRISREEIEWRNRIREAALAAEEAKKKERPAIGERLDDTARKRPGPKPLPPDEVLELLVNAAVGLLRSNMDITRKNLAWQIGKDESRVRYLLEVAGRKTVDNVRRIAEERVNNTGES